MAAGCFLHLSSFVQSVHSVPPLIQGEQLMALVALSCQWSRARLCACSVRFFYGEEARKAVPPSLPFLPPLLSDSVWEGTLWCIGRLPGREPELRDSLILYFFVASQAKDHPVFFASSSSSSSFVLFLPNVILCSTRRAAVIRSSRLH